MIENCAPNGKSFHHCVPFGQGKSCFKLACWCLQAEQHYAAAPWILRADHPLDREPCRLALLRLELPPVRLDAGGIQLGQCLGYCFLPDRSMSPGNDFDEELAADTACCVIEAAKLPPLLSLEAVSILGVIKGQAFNRVRHRPLDEPRPDVARTLEVEGPRARLLD